MFVYIYDGSFEGLLTSIYEAYYRTDKPEKILTEFEYEPDLIYTPLYIQTDNDKFCKVYEAINNKISTEVLQTIYHVYLSELKNSSTLIYNYIKLGFKLGSNIVEYLHLNKVLEVQNICKKVSSEAHIMLGFVRFTNLHNDIYYSQIEPDYNILSLVSPHFASRLSNQRWIIHDLKRNLASLYDGNEWTITDFDKNKFVKFNLKDKEELYEKLWKDYFKATTIENRLNPKAQRRSMPTRYHKHLTELL